MTSNKFLNKKHHVFYCFTLYITYQGVSLIHDSKKYFIILSVILYIT
nr:MAG TPA: hypothetical protein [Caudoviricetes sp.]